MTCRLLILYKLTLGRLFNLYTCGGLGPPFYFYKIGRRTSLVKGMGDFMGVIMLYKEVWKSRHHMSQSHKLLFFASSMPFALLHMCRHVADKCVTI